ncbi:MAG: HyaD/HybD family hydrogenase maturation endopeptidase [Betaproteobacteria bacterium]|nr:HyaD/HybD family hydrogenase maturation endopeptidase [Betaproteobacteria bacterium]
MTSFPGASRTPRILVLGIGNLLWADEGFGVRCVEALIMNRRFPKNVTLLDGGTQGLYLLPQVQEADALLVFDAVDYGDPPGTLREITGDEVPRFMGVKKMSLHQTGFQEVLSAAELTGKFPEKLVLVGVQPENLEDFGGSLSAVVREKVPEAIECALRWLAQWGAPGEEVIGENPADPLSMTAYEAGRPARSLAWREGDARFVNLLCEQGED